MSSQTNDRINDARRDATIETLLAQHSGMNGSNTPCPDAEVLAAYADHSLDDAEAARWEIHFAQCERCQDVLGAIAASQQHAHEDVMAAALAQPAAARATAQPAQPKRSSKMWLVGIAAVAAVVAFFVLRPTSNQNAPTQTANNAQSSQQNAAPPPVTGGTSEYSSNAQAEQPRKKAPATPSQPPVNLREAAEEPRIQINPVVSPNENLNVDNLTPATTGIANSETDANGSTNGAVGGFGAGARGLTRTNRSAATAALAMKAATPTPQNPNALSEKARDQAYFAAQDQAKNQLAEKKEQTAGGARAGVAGGLASTFNSVLVFPLHGNVMWRIGLDGAIEKSSDSGMTWTRQQSGTNAQLIAGSAPDNQVCWVVGDGVILHTSDGGNTWTKAATPQPLNGALLDWTAVFATDGQNAHVASVDGRRFETKDGGQTWTAVGQ